MIILTDFKCDMTMVLKICCKTLQGNKDVADSQANLVPNPPVSTDFPIPTESINKMSWDKSRLEILPEADLARWDCF